MNSSRGVIDWPHGKWHFVDRAKNEGDAVIPSSRAIACF